MAGHNSWLAIYGLSYLIILISINPSPSLASSLKVQVSVYYEALCPFCANFIVNQLVKIFQNGLISAVDLRLVPWGNAWSFPNGTSVCQHGADECLLNTVEACTITIFPNVNQHYNFVHCVESLTLANRHNQWTDCLGTAKVGRAPIDCYNRGYGKQIEDRYASETANLKPPHRFVPWVVVNNQPLLEDYQNYMIYICKAFKGSPKPVACLSLMKTEIESTEEINVTPEACFAGESRSFTSLGLEEKLQADKQF